MLKEEFLEKKSSGKIFSVIEELRGDFLTPIGIFHSLRGKRKFIFESGTRGINFGRYSFIGCLNDLDKEILSLEEVNEKVKEAFDNDSNKLPFKGGAIGYTAYNLIGKYETRLKYANEDRIQVKDCLFNFYKDYICFDHFTQKVLLVIFIDKNV